MDKSKYVRMNAILAEQIYRANFAQKLNSEVVSLLLQRFYAGSHPGHSRSHAQGIRGLVGEQ